MPSWVPDAPSTTFFGQPSDTSDTFLLVLSELLLLAGEGAVGAAVLHATSLLRAAAKGWRGNWRGSSACMLLRELNDC